MKEEKTEVAGWRRRGRGKQLERMEGRAMKEGGGREGKKERQGEISEGVGGVQEGGKGRYEREKVREREK